MKITRHRRKGSHVTDATARVGASISPQEVCRTLEEVAPKNNVFLIWVVRAASKQYIADKRPLLKKSMP